MIPSSYWFFAFLVIFFAVGFLISWARAKRSMGRMKYEIADLRKRLQNTERLLSSTWFEDEAGEADPVPAAPIDLEASNDQEATKKTQGSTRPEEPERRPGRRRVLVTKVEGRNRELVFPTSIVGVEIGPPAIGESYRVLRENGRAFRTSHVTDATPGYIRTLNSLYKIEHLDGVEAVDGGAKGNHEPERYRRGVL